MSCVSFFIIKLKVSTSYSFYEYVSHLKPRIATLRRTSAIGPKTRPTTETGPGLIITTLSLATRDQTLIIALDP